MTWAVIDSVTCEFCLLVIAMHLPSLQQPCVTVGGLASISAHHPNPLEHICMGCRWCRVMRAVPSHCPAHTTYPIAVCHNGLDCSHAHANILLKAHKHKGGSLRADLRCWSWGKTTIACLDCWRGQGVFWLLPRYYSALNSYFLQQDFTISSCRQGLSLAYRQLSYFNALNVIQRLNQDHPWLCLRRIGVFLTASRQFETWDPLTNLV